MNYSIEKYDGRNMVAWNGTVEDLNGFEVKVINKASNNSFWGRVENGKARANKGFALNQIAKALNEIKGGQK